MRNVWYSTLALMIVAFAPSVAADDPSYSVPDPSPVTGAAILAVEETRADVLAFNESTQQNAAAAGENVTDQTFPGTVVEDQIGDAAGVAGDAAGRGATVGFTALDFGNTTANGKVEEVFATQAAVDSIGDAAVTAAGVVANAAQDAACDHPVLEGGAPNACDDGSIVAAALSAVDGTLWTIENNSADFNDTLGAVAVALQNILGS